MWHVRHVTAKGAGRQAPVLVCRRSRVVTMEVGGGMRGCAGGKWWK